MIRDLFVERLALDLIGPGSPDEVIGDLTRHTQSILERAQAYADAQRVFKSPACRRWTSV